MTAIGSTIPLTPQLKEGTKAWPRWAALSGVLFGVLLTVGFVLTTGTPSDTASASKVQTWYVDHSHRIGAAALVTAFTVIVGVFFYNYLRSVFRHHDPAEWRSSLYFTGVIIFAVSGALSAGIDASLNDKPKILSAGGMQTLNMVSQNLTWPIESIGLALLYLGAGLVIHKTRVLPRWTAWVSWVLALLAASFFLGFIAFIATALWVVVIGVWLAVRNPAL